MQQAASEWGTLPGSEKSGATDREIGELNQLQRLSEQNEWIADKNSALRVAQDIYIIYLVFVLKRGS